MTLEAAARPRQSAEERREQVIEAAIREFAEAGYNAASTAAIANAIMIRLAFVKSPPPDCVAGAR